MVELRQIGVVSKQVLLKLLSGTADANIRFDDLRSLLNTMGFSERMNGSHHIFTKPEVLEILNLQPVRGVIVRYKLAGGAE